MDYVRLGSTGIKVSPITLGTMQFGWRINEEESFKIMDKAIELGINIFDTADIYSAWAENSYAGKTEEIIGKWLKERKLRDDLILASKLRGGMSDDINNRGLSRRHIWQAVKGSLKRLKADWIDLYQIHSFDPDTNIEETLHGLTQLVDQGIVNYIGASNVHPWQFVESLWMSERYGYAKFETLQPVYNLARRFLVEYQFDHVIKKYGIGVLPYSPLGGGFFTGKYSRDTENPDTPRSKGVAAHYFSERKWQTLDAVKEIAAAKGVPVSQIALAWVMSRDFITSPIVGANNVQQLEENVGAVEITLTQAEITTLTDVSNFVEEYEKMR